MVRVRAAWLGLFLAIAAPVEASCRLALLLGIDISSSVDRSEDRLQREGLARALESPGVVDAILGGSAPVALAVFEWSGRYQQDMTMGWRMLESHGDITAAAAHIRNSQRKYAEFPTAAGYALSYAVTVFKEAPACDAQVLDLSGDGLNNDGYGPQQVHRNHRFAGKTVNGLAIGGGTDSDAELFLFYRQAVIYGPGAFVETADDYPDFERAMRRKLERELREAQLSHMSGK